MQCPSDESLAALLEDALSEDEARALRTHVASCVHCGDLFGALEASTPGSTALDGERDQTQSALESGTILGDSYRVVRAIGRGGMGTVYEAEHTRLGHHVAVKVLRPELRRNAAALERFRREARVCASSDHPHVVRVIDFDPASQPPFLVMELLEGESLAERIEDAGPLPPWLVVRILGQVAEALSWAHRQGILHRDIKPSNIFLCRPQGSALGNVKVLDFGVSKIRGPLDATLTKPWEMLGTPAYMAPEMVQRDDEPSDARSDLFALGAVAYQALTGVRPFDADSLPTLLYRIVHVQPRGVREREPDVPERLARLVMRLLSKKAEHRPSSADQVVAELRDIERKLHVQPWSRAVWLGAAALLIAAVLGSGMKWYADHKPNRVRISGTHPHRVIIGKVPKRPSTTSADAPTTD